MVLAVNSGQSRTAICTSAINGRPETLLSRIPGLAPAYTVRGLGLVAAALTFIFAEPAADFNIVTGIGAGTVPVASTIMAMERFSSCQAVGLRRPLHRVASWSETRAGQLAGDHRASAGHGVGLTPADSFRAPPVRAPTSDFPALQAWVTGAVAYLVIVRAGRQESTGQELFGYSQMEETPSTGTAARVCD